MAPRAWLILALAGACAAPPAHAAVFAMVRAQPDAITVMDPAAVETPPGAANLRRAYSVTVQKSLVAEGPQQPGYVRTLNEYDCAARTLRWKSFSVYSRFGDLVIRKDNPAETWETPAAGSEGEASLRLVCDHANRWSAMAAGSLSASTNCSAPGSLSAGPSPEPRRANRPRQVTPPRPISSSSPARVEGPALSAGAAAKATAIRQKITAAAVSGSNHPLRPLRT